MQWALTPLFHLGALHILVKWWNILQFLHWYPEVGNWKPFGLPLWTHFWQVLTCGCHCPLLWWFPQCLWKSASFGRVKYLFFLLTIAVSCLLLLIVIVASRALVGSAKSNSVGSTSFMLSVGLDLVFFGPFSIVCSSSMSIGVICDAFYLLTCILFKLGNYFCFPKCEAWSLFDTLFH